MFELECAVQNYHWGKLGLSSTVAKLAEKNNSLSIEPDKKYAELWMGTHKSGPSIITPGGQLLLDNITEKPSCLGTKSLERFGPNLPFLFKVLSVNQALSIQVHPDKKLAEKLHVSHPDLYKDDNHKPEIAIALTEFEALCGFRPLEEIKKNLRDIPELRALVGEENANNLEQSTDDNYIEPLRNCLQTLLTQPKESVDKQLNLLTERANDSMDVCFRVDIGASLLLNLVKDYPGDVGCFVIYFLNYIIMKPGDAIYLDANIPHAYLKGDCIECMACSDNVIRAGLTPKFKDVKTLCAVLDYECTSRSKRIFHPIEEDAFTKLFAPHVPDFAVAEIKIPANQPDYKLIKRSSASILLAVAGKGIINTDQIISEGKCFFLIADEEITIKATEDLIIFQAFANP